MCNLLCPVAGDAYSIEEQARLQFLSIVLVIAGLIKSKDYNMLLKVMRDDFEVSTRLGIVFKRLVRVLFCANFFVIAFIISVSMHSGVRMYMGLLRLMFSSSVP